MVASMTNFNQSHAFYLVAGALLLMVVARKHLWIQHVGDVVVGGADSAGKQKVLALSIACYPFQFTHNFCQPLYACS